MKKAAADDELCAHCGGRNPTSRCSRCGLVKYCGAPCQRANWPAHKPACLAPEQRAREAAQAAAPPRAPLAAEGDECVKDGKVSSPPEDPQAKKKTPSSKVHADADFALRNPDGGPVNRVSVGATVLYSDLCPSFVHRLNWEQKRVRENPDGVVAELVPCGTCGETLPRGRQQKCTGCKLAIYCSSKCQATAWKYGHNAVCKAAGYLLRVRKDSIVCDMADRAKKGLYPFRVPEAFRGNAESGTGAYDAGSDDGGPSMSEAISHLEEARIPHWLALSCAEYYASPEHWFPPPRDGLSGFTPGEQEFCHVRGLNIDGNACKATSAKALRRLTAKAKKTKVALPCGERRWLGGSLSAVDPSGAAASGSFPVAAWERLRDVNDDRKRTEWTEAAARVKAQDNRHAKVEVPLGQLLDGQVQCPKCPPNGFSGVSSGLFSYSFCTGKPESQTAAPGSVTHCAACGVCRDYMYYHCTLGCGKCSYPRSVPCRWCHLLVLGSDGIRFLPLDRGRCAAGGCRCGQGKSVWKGSTAEGVLDMASEFFERKFAEAGLPQLPRNLVAANLAARGVGNA